MIGSAPLLAFTGTVLAVTGVHLLLPERRPGERTRRGFGSRLLALLAALGDRLRPGSGARIPLDLEGRMAAAGLTGRAGTLTSRDLMAAKLAAAAVLGTVGVLLGAVLPGRLGILVAVAAPVAGFLAPDLWLRRRAVERFREVRRQLPATLDLLRVTVDAGLSLPDALGAVGARTGGPLGVEWRLLAREVALGVPLPHALTSMTERLPMPEVASLAGALERASRHGSPLVETLAAQSRDARLGRRRRIAEEAARAGPKIQLVVALLLVPSVLLLIAAALVAAFVDSGGGLGVA